MKKQLCFFGFMLGALSCQPKEVCGDKIVTESEQCDDGNAFAGDGCNLECEIEIACGNNFLTDGEVCDDGNKLSGDGCRDDCLSEEPCGDAFVDVGGLCYIDGPATAVGDTP